MRLSIVSSHRATIELTGALDLRPEPLAYRASPSPGKTGHFEFDLGPNARALLRRMRTSLRSAEYDAGADRAHVRVKPPMIPAMHIGLERVPSARSTRGSARERRG